MMNEFNTINRNLPSAPLNPEQVVSYARKSTREEGAKKSIEDQNEVNCETAEEWGLPLVPGGMLSEKPGCGGNLFWDGYIRSGLDGDANPEKRTRPELTKIMKGVMNDTIKCVIVYSQDRLWRDVSLCKVMIDIMGERGCLLYDRKGPVDISSYEGRNSVLQNAVASQHAREKAQTESPRGIRRSRNKGKKVVKGNTLGFRDVPGVRGGVRHVPEEQEMVRRIFRLFDAGENGNGPLTPQGIARLLMAEGYEWALDMKPPIQRHHETKRVIWVDTVRQVLTNCRYQGRQQHEGKEWPCPAFLNEGEPVVPVALYERVQAKMNSLKRGGNASRNKYALGGLIICGVCGQSMYAAVTSITCHGEKLIVRSWQAAKSPTWAWCTHTLPVLQHRIIDAYVNDILAPDLMASVREKAVEGDEQALANEKADMERRLAEQRHRHDEVLPTYMGQVPPTVLKQQYQRCVDEMARLESSIRELADRSRSLAAQISHIDNFASLDAATRRDAVRATLRWVAVIPHDHDRTWPPGMLRRGCRGEEGGKVVFLSAQGEFHTAIIYREHLPGQQKRTASLRRALPHESITSMQQFPNVGHFIKGLERSYRGRWYKYLPEDIGPGYYDGQNDAGPVEYDLEKVEVLA